MRAKIITAAKKKKKESENEEQQWRCQKGEWQIEQFKANLRRLVGNDKWTLGSYQAHCVTLDRLNWHETRAEAEEAQWKKKMLPHTEPHACGSHSTHTDIKYDPHVLIGGLKIAAVALAHSNVGQTWRAEASGCMCSTGRRRSDAIASAAAYVKNAAEHDAEPRGPPRFTPPLDRK